MTHIRSLALLSFKEIYKAIKRISPLILQRRMKLHHTGTLNPCIHAHVDGGICKSGAVETTWRQSKKKMVTAMV